MRFRAVKRMLKLVGVVTIVLMIANMLLLQDPLPETPDNRRVDVLLRDPMQWTDDHSFHRRVSGTRDAQWRHVETSRNNAYLEAGLTNVSRTKPAFYPIGGTGTTVNITKQLGIDAISSPIGGTGRTVNITTQLGMGVISSESLMMAYNGPTDWHKLCQSDKPLDAIVPIYSAPDNYDRRAAMRDTVGRECRLVYNCRLVFIIGISTNQSSNAAVKQEYDTEHDIVIINKIDTYRDLNNKAVAMLDWLIQVCPQPKYVIHIIDDTYPNLRYIFHQLKKIQTNKFILGKPAVTGRPVRYPDPNSSVSKWFLSRWEYPYFQLPRYLVGTVYAFRNADCRLLREKVHKAEYVWIEDVWFTGLVAKAAGFQMFSFATYGPGDLMEPDMEKLEAAWNMLPYIHNVPPELFRDVLSISISVNHLNLTTVH